MAVRFRFTVLTAIGTAAGAIAIDARDLNEGADRPVISQLAMSRDLNELQYYDFQIG